MMAQCSSPPKLCRRTEGTILLERHVAGNRAAEKLRAKNGRVVDKRKSTTRASLDIRPSCKVTVDTRSLRTSRQQSSICALLVLAFPMPQAGITKTSEECFYVEGSPMQEYA